MQMRVRISVLTKVVGRELEESQGVQYDVPGLLLGLLTQAAGFAVLATLSQRLFVQRERRGDDRAEFFPWWALAAAGTVVGGGGHYAACGWIDQERGVCEKVGFQAMQLWNQPSQLYISSPWPSQLYISTPWPSQLYISTPWPSQLYISSPWPSQLYISTPCGQMKRQWISRQGPDRISLPIHPCFCRIFKMASL